MSALPLLLKDLDAEQRMRVLALDYVTSCGFVAPEDWLLFSTVVAHYLRTGEVALEKARIHTFPTAVD
jgi:hypothetical protein